MNKAQLISVLSKLHNDIVETDDYSGVTTALDTIRINNLVQYFIHQEAQLDTDDILITGYIIKILQTIYNNMDIPSPVTDEDFDALYEIFISSSNNNIVGATNPKNKKMGFHRYPDLRGTLEKVHFLNNKEKGTDKRKSIEGWLSTVENKLGRPLSPNEEDVELFPKFDGVSVIFECSADGSIQKVLTRGDVELNEAVDITALFGAVKFNPMPKWGNVEFGIKTEVIMTQDNYKKLCKKFGKFNSPRSAVSSIINSNELDTKFLKYLTIVPLRVQNFETKEIIIHPQAYTLYPTLQFIISKYSDMKVHFDMIRETVREIMGIPIDGIVIYFKNPEIRTLLGRDGHINKYEIAYKFPPESKKTKLLSVEFCIGSLGSVTPVGKIEPVMINNNTISNVSLGSMDRFDTLYLREGDEVIVKYDIIPYLFKDETCVPSDNEYIKAPTHCEYCHEKLIKDPILRCVNNECPSRIIGKIVNYIDKMGISNISIATVSTLFRKGYLTCIEDLYKLNDHKMSIVQLDGFGDKSFSNIVKGINSRTTVFDYELLGSLGIPDIGRRIFKKILNIYYMDDLISICINSEVNKLTSIYGIKEKTANKIIVGILTNLKVIEFLKGVLKVKQDKRKYDIKVVFTKVRDKDFEEYLDTKNVQIMDSYSKEVNMVIVKDKNTESTKITKAKKDGKDVVTLAEAYDLFGYKPQGD